MLKMFQIVRDYINIMARCPPCCLLTSSLTYLFIAVITLDLQSIEGTTTKAPTTTTPKPPFLESTMFIGLAAGIGGFVAFCIFGCFLWKCCCGGNHD